SASVAEVHSFTSDSRRSSSKMNPFSKSDWIFVALASYSPKTSGLEAGDTTSDMATVMPERVAQKKPASMKLSNASATSTLSYRSARSLMMLDKRLLSTVALTNG